MTTAKPEQGPNRFKKLPEHVALEDTTPEHPAVDPPEPDLGRDPEQDFFMRNAGA